MIENSLKFRAIFIAQGNPGVAHFLVDLLHENDKAFINPFFIAFELTKSRSYAIWQVHKDICNFDMRDTKKVLKQWYSSSCEPLEVWVNKQKEEQKRIISEVKGE